MSNKTGYTCIRLAETVIYRAIIKKGQTWKNLGNRWQINSALIAKIDLLFLLTDLQVAINLKNRLDFFSKSK